MNVYSKNKNKQEKTMYMKKRINELVNEWTQQTR